MKRFLSVTVCAVVITCLICTAFAAGSLPKIVDEADLLTAIQEQTLVNRAQALADSHQMDVVILTVESTDGQSITPFADNYYDDNGYGIGSDYSGVLLVLAMDEREWAISTCGNAIDALADYEQEQLMDRVVSHFSRGDYYSGFHLYLRDLDSCLATRDNGAVRFARDNIKLILISLLIGIVVGSVTILILKSGMKTAVAQKGASSYIKAGSYKLLRQQDIFLYSRTQKIRRSEGSSGGSGSSSHRSSSGRSHGGSRGRF